MTDLKKANIIQVRISAEDVGLRLDKALSKISEVGSRSRAESLIDAGKVLLNKKSVKSSQKVSIDDLIEIEIPEPQDLALKKYDFPLEIFFEDEFLMVINKPPGLVVHPAAGHESDTLVNALVSYSDEFLMKFNDRRPGIVHRLDKETSGLLVIAKNDLILEGLARQFKERTVHRIYQAIVLGVPRPSKGRTCSYLARHPQHRKKYSSVLGSDRKPIREPQQNVEHGKWAATNFETLLTHQNEFSLVRLKLETGRTHQIRVHLSELGNPILSDDIYGSPKRTRSLGGKETQSLLKTSQRCALHAMELGFRHPITQTDLMFQADWPDHNEIIDFLSHSKKGTN